MLLCLIFLSQYFFSHTGMFKKDRERENQFKTKHRRTHFNRETQFDVLEVMMEVPANQNR